MKIIFASRIDLKADLIFLGLKKEKLIIKCVCKVSCSLFNVPGMEQKTWKQLKDP